MQRKPQTSCTSNAKNVWLLRQSRRFPGEFYCFNTATGEAMWCRQEDRSSFSRSFDNDANSADDTTYYPEPTSPPHSYPTANPNPTFSTMPTYLPRPSNLNPMYANVWPISNNQKMYLVPALPIFVPNTTNMDSRTDRKTQTSRSSTPVIVETTQTPQRFAEISHVLGRPDRLGFTTFRGPKITNLGSKIDGITQTSRTNSPVITETAQAYGERLKTMSHTIKCGNGPNSSLGHRNRADFATIRERTKSMSTQTVDTEVAVARKRTFSDDSEIVKRDDEPMVKIGKKAASVTDLSSAGQSGSGWSLDLDSQDSPPPPAAKKTDNVPATQNPESPATTVNKEPQNKIGPVDVLSVVNLTKDDLRYKLMARKKIGDVCPKVLSETESSTAKFQDLPPPNSTEAVKKKVTFNLPVARAGSLSSLSSEIYFEDREGTFAELPPPAELPQKAYDTAKLRSLTRAPAAEPNWYIVADEDVLLDEFGFIEDLVKTDHTCRLMVPSVVQSRLGALSQGSSVGRQNVLAARQLSRRLDGAQFVVHEAKTDTLNETDGIIECCKRHHAVLITNRASLLTKALSRDLNALSVEAAKKLVAQPEPQLFEAKKIQITFKNSSVTDMGRTENCSLTIDAKGKPKWTKEVRYLDESLDEAKTKKVPDKDANNETVVQENSNLATNGKENKHGKGDQVLDKRNRETMKVKAPLAPILTKDLRNHKSANDDKEKYYRAILKKFAKGCQTTGLDLDKLLTKTVKVTIVRCDNELKGLGSIVTKNTEKATKEKVTTKSTDLKEKTKTPQRSDKKSPSENKRELKKYNEKQSASTDTSTSTPQKRFKLTLKRRDKNSFNVKNEDTLTQTIQLSATNGNSQESSNGEITNTPQTTSTKITLKKIDKQFVVINNLAMHVHKNTDSATSELYEKSEKDEKTKEKRKICDQKSPNVNNVNIKTTDNGLNELENPPVITRPNTESNATFTSTTTTLSSEITWRLEDLELREISPILCQKKNLKPAHEIWSPSILTNGLCHRLKRVQDSVSLKAVVDGFENELDKFCEVELPEEKFVAKKEEWLCRFLQILEEALTSLVHTNGAPVPDLLAPFLLEEVLCAVRQVYSVVGESTEKRLRLACDEISGLFVYTTERGEFVRIKANVSSKELMRAMGSGGILLRTLLTLDPAKEPLQSAAQWLDELVRDVKDPSSIPDVTIFDFKVKISCGGADEYEEHVGQKVTKQPSEILEYLRKHYPAWRDEGTQINGKDGPQITNGEDAPQTTTEELVTNGEVKSKSCNTFKIIRTFGRNLDKLKLHRDSFALASPGGRQKLHELTNESAAGQSNDDQPTRPLVVTFLVEISEFFSLVYNFVKKAVAEFQDGVQEHRQEVLSRKANRTRRVVTSIKKKLQRIVKREESASECSLKALAAKAGLNANHNKLSRYRQVVMKLLEQANLLNGCLNTIVDLGNGNTVDVKAIEKACHMNYINIFDNVC